MTDCNVDKILHTRNVKEIWKKHVYKLQNTVF